MMGTQRSHRTALLVILLGAAVGCGTLGCGGGSFFEPGDESTSDEQPGDSSSESNSDSTSSESNSDSTSSGEDETESSVDVEFTRERVGENRVWSREFAPVTTWKNEQEELYVRNIVQQRVPLVAHVYVHSGGVLLGRVEGSRRLGSGLPPGESRFMPAPKETPKRVIEKMKTALVDQGFSESRADEILEKKGDDLFRKHGARTVYIAPDRLIEQRDLEPLGAVAAPLPPWRQ